ncbi:MAG: zinc-ribbon domain-containing protein, partial [Promethearchaeota archaeon]
IPETPTPTPEVSTTTSLFQTLSQKTEPEKPSVAAAFMPFTAKTEPESQETSKLRIIPNVSNIETFPSQKQPGQAKQAKPAGKEIIICKQCGAILSSDYQFCNKCGSEL